VIPDLGDRLPSAGGRVLLLLDFDGTVAPTVSDPRDAAIPVPLQQVLRRLAASGAARVGIVSSRELGDLRSRVVVPGVVFVGSGGIEFDIDGMCFVTMPPKDCLAELDHARCAAGEAMATLEGVWIEDKTHGFTIHHRGAAACAVEAVRVFARGLQLRRPTVAVIVGTLGVEVAADATHDKGTAVGVILRTLVEEFEMVIFAGNDANDAAAMRAAEKLGGLSVAIGDSSPPAMLHLRDVDGLTRFLEELAAGLRSPIHEAR
jgi:trehalose-phosphatase